MEHCEKTPFLLVGLKIDLRDDPATLKELSKNHTNPIRFEQGKILAKELTAVKYVECSALTQVSLINPEISVSCAPTTLVQHLIITVHLMGMSSDWLWLTDMQLVQGFLSWKWPNYLNLWFVIKHPLCFSLNIEDLFVGLLYAVLKQYIYYIFYCKTSILN